MTDPKRSPATHRAPSNPAPPATHRTPPDQATPATHRTPPNQAPPTPPHPAPATHQAPPNPAPPTPPHPAEPGNASHPPAPRLAAPLRKVAAFLADVPLSRAPYAFFGHSPGAPVSYGIRALRDAGRQQPDRLIVSGFPAPHHRQVRASDPTETLGSVGRS
ncbi:thioesterase domain-containing protein [Streptomyces sp. NPDC050485]|uniref:thioesterase domain-containing protein n=1 Tax=Streptomyces sp. NPDC050485 TaxID=3365617 RepID=UPI00379AABF2